MKALYFFIYFKTHRSIGILSEVIQPLSVAIRKKLSLTEEVRALKLFERKVFLPIIGALFILTSGCAQSDKAVTEPAASQQKSGEKTSMDAFTVLQETADSFFKQPVKTVTTEDVFEKMILNYDPATLIVDVRETAAFAAGHIEGSVNIPYKMTADPNQIANLPKDKKILVVCYSGHTASQTAALWNMLGYDATPMVNGMGGWTSDAALGTPLPQKPFEFPVENQEIKAESFDLPIPLNKQYKTEKEVIIGTAQDYLKSNLPPILKPSVIQEEAILKKSPNYLLVDLRPAAEYKSGHIPRAINIPYENLAETDQLKKLAAGKKIILIDHDGTMASMAARVLSLLGYEAYAMKDGMRVWTSDPAINGIAPISTQKAMGYPVKLLNTKLETESGAASCG